MLTTHFLFSLDEITAIPFSSPTISSVALKMQDISSDPQQSRSPSERYHREPFSHSPEIWGDRTSRSFVIQFSSALALKRTISSARALMAGDCMPLWKKWGTSFLILSDVPAIGKER